ncbi:MAG: hypothetical protein KKH28_01125 [Elusimicrobia bacterium]|nr:hypothetical protein [Elusimicrobiota bacterium]
MRRITSYSALAVLLLAGPCFGAKPAAGSKTTAAKTGTEKNAGAEKTPPQCTKFIGELNKRIPALERQLKTCNATKPAKECATIKRKLNRAKQTLKSVTRVCSFAQGLKSSFSGLNTGSDKDAGIDLKNSKSGVVSNLNSSKTPSVSNSALPAVPSTGQAAKAGGDTAKSGWGGFLSRISEAGRTALNTGKGIVGDVVGVVKDVPAGIVRDLGSAGKNLLKGNFKDAAKDAGGAVVNAATRTAGGVVDSVAKVVLGAVDIVDTTLLGKPLPRALTAEEKKLLSGVYKGSVDLDKVRVRQDSSSHLFLPAHVIGNTIYFKDKLGPLTNADGTLTYDGNTLIHETGHVWQSQHGGGDYLHKALFANVKAAIFEGSRNKAYEWKPQAARGVPFADLNPEQQATVIDNLAADELRPAGKKWLTPEETAYARAALELVRAGQGAP